MSALRGDLLAWYRAHKRDLPWRRTRDPYAIWLSETMLQQTRVETVIPYYERFLERFPDVAALADAEPDEVAVLWSGLGYYSRARNLHAAARAVVQEHGGRLPDDPEALRALPGIGRYTAGAVASIAFDRPAPIVDGNVARVLARVHGLREPLASPAAQRALWREAEALVQGPAPGDLNQALMELGAVVCTPRAPRCPACPLRTRCAAHASGEPEALPVKTKSAAPRRIIGVAALLARAGKLLAVRRPPAGLLGGLWDLPGGLLAPRESPAQGLERCLSESVGLALRGAAPLGRVRHLFTHRDLTLHVFSAEALPGRVARRGFDAHRWVSRAAFSRLGLPAVARKALALGDSPRML